MLATNMIPGFMKKICKAILAAVCLTACAAPSHVATSRTAPGSLAEKPPLRAPEYRLGFGDVLEFRFLINTEFDETAKVRPDGRISLLGVGDLYVEGMTPSQVDSIVTLAYGEFVREPDITVIVREFGGNQVYVLGEVLAPGGYEIQRRMTLLQAVAAAGGATNLAKLSSVMVLRRRPGEEIEAIKVSLSKSIKAESAEDISMNDIYVRPLDIVFVPKTFIGSAATFMKQVYDGFLPPLDLYLRALLYYN